MIAHTEFNAAFSNSSGLKSVFGKLHLRDGLVWTLGLTVEIKLRLQISLTQCGPGGYSRIYGLYRYVQPQRVWFFSRFGHK